MWVDLAFDVHGLSRTALAGGDEVVVRVGLWTAGVLAGLYAGRIALAWSLMALARVGSRSRSSQPRPPWQRNLVGAALRVTPGLARARLLRWSGVAVTASAVIASAGTVANANTLGPTPSPSSTSGQPTSGQPTSSRAASSREAPPMLDRGAVRPPQVTLGRLSSGRVARTVVVRRGDTLWDIAARHLGGQVSNSRIAAAWPRWYRLNRDVIGSDPNLIRPGMTLRTPAADREVTR